MPKNLARTPKPGARPVYQNKPLRQHTDDSYKSNKKLAEPTVCPECGAVFHDGHWQWLSRPERAHELHCPACQRIHDHVAAGFVNFKGEFFREHYGEIIRLVRNVEDKEKAGHPLQRIMDISDQLGTVTVATTDAHLARAIGEAVRHAYHGQLEFKYGEDENLIRVTWMR